MKRSSGFNGVSLNRSTRRWEACVWLPNETPVSNTHRRKRGRQLYCGSYGEALVAAAARDSVLMALYGAHDDARLNFSHTKEEAADMYALGVAAVRTRVMREGRAGESRGRAKGSGFKGVTKTAGGFEARCHTSLHGDGSYIGRFRTEEEAAAAYDRRALEARGPLAATNFDWTDAQRFEMTFGHEQALDSPCDDPSLADDRALADLTDLSDLEL